ncbi:hypothetical protein [Quatrionicoccus australiensis]|uniref:hypothetical protein n=1 Tax=Quatrionicoccus australiensis TaxID=138118 RepID=UPI001CF87A35|nr:hypothetical protein [Quatrionicoccus australiensis]UCV14540.1 hypothetical protein KI612_16605 [Quatrionicoccus australiensis]
MDARDHNQARGLKVPDLQTFTGSTPYFAVPFQKPPSVGKEQKAATANFAALKNLPDPG